VGVARGGAEHQCVIGARAFEKHGTRETGAVASCAEPETPASGWTLGELRLGRQQVHDAAHRAASIEHRTGSLDDFDALEQAEVEEGRDRALWLRRVDADAI